MRSKSTSEKRQALLSMEPPEGEQAAWERHLIHVLTPDECADLYDEIIRVGKLFSGDDVPPSWRKSFENSPMMKLLQEHFA